MTVERIVRIVAGFFVLLSLSLGVEASPIFHHPYWLFFTVFVGLNLFQSGFTTLCPLASILEKVGVKTEAACATETGKA
ncbi:MAG: sulfurtransferase [Leptospiraceae bacterium]|nr:sulfurtransferase [Leptospiraceae bacterium]